MENHKSTELLPNSLAKQQKMLLRKETKASIITYPSKSSTGKLVIEFEVNGVPVKINEMDTETAFAIGTNLFESATKINQNPSKYKKKDLDPKADMFVYLENAYEIFDCLTKREPNNLSARINKDLINFMILDAKQNDLREIDLLNGAIDIYKEGLEIGAIGMAEKIRWIEQKGTKLRMSSEKLLDHMLLKNPMDMEATLFKAKVRYSIGELGEALTLLDIVISNSPQNIEAFELKANILMFAGDHDGAMDAVNRSLCVDPNNSKALIQKGDILTVQGKLHEAYKVFVRAQETDEGTTAKIRVADTLLKIRERGMEETPEHGEEDVADTDDVEMLLTDEGTIPTDSGKGHGRLN